MANLNSVPRLLEAVDLEEIAGEILAFDGETLTRLTGGAAAVVKNIDGVRSVSDLSLALGADAREAIELLVDNALVALDDEPEASRLRRPDHVATCRDEDRIVLADLASGERHVLQGVGASVWDLVIAGHSLGAVVDHLERLYPDSSAMSETYSLVDQLVDLGLLERYETLDEDRSA